MSREIDREARNNLINRLAVEVDLPDVARSLGLRVISQGTTTPRALCPFHDDRHPSLYLYPSRGGGRPQFHCFACEAHGDVFDLIKKQLGTDFLGALDWLAGRQRIDIPTRAPVSRREAVGPRMEGLKLGFDIYK